MIWLLYSIFVMPCWFFFVNRRTTISVFPAVIACMVFTVTVVNYFNETDWVNYGYAFYNKLSSFGEFGSEPLLYIVFFIGKFLFGDFFLSVIMFLALNSYFLFKLAENKTIDGATFLILVSLLLGPTLLGEQIRQAFALNFIGFSILALEAERIKRAVFFILIAALAHISALVFLIIVPFLYLSRKKAIFIGVVCYCFILFFLFNANLIASSLESISYFVGLSLRLSLYLNIIDINVGRLGFFAVFDAAFIVFFLTEKNENTRFEGKILNGVILMAVAHLSFYAFPIFQRITSYLVLFPCILAARYIKIYLSGERLTSRMTFFVTTLFLMALAIFFKELNNPLKAGFGNEKIYYPLRVYGENEFNELRNIRCTKVDNSDANKFGFCRWD